MLCVKYARSVFIMIRCFITIVIMLFYLVFLILIYRIFMVRIVFNILYSLPTKVGEISKKIQSGKIV